MANLYNVPLKNAVQKTLANTLLSSETGTITFSTSVTSDLQASSSIPGILVIDRVDSNGNLTPALTEYISFEGVSGSTVTTLVRGLGGTSAQDHSIGAIVEFVPDVVWADAINDVFTEQHNSDGTHKPLSGISLASTSITTSLIDTFSFKNLNAPEGFLINGKIVPSVASNNLTVAIKTLAGNDPSASDPVYVRINDTIRTITSATSHTSNAGTNWCNSGSTKLAGLEVDYFVYLIYSTSSNSVEIGFSRIPYATIISNFDTSGTDKDKSIIAPAVNNTDVCTVIGRFAATLSAGASYNWSVPTYNSSNLIQRPIYNTRTLSMVTTVTPTSPMTLTSTENTNVYYNVSGITCYCNITALSDFGGTASNRFDITLPFASGAFTEINASINVSENSYNITGSGTIYVRNTAATGEVRKVPLAVWNLNPTTGMISQRVIYDLV